jgi:pimeloyl-ACP methyl ester carboxylesterase
MPINRKSNHYISSRHLIAAAAILVLLVGCGEAATNRQNGSSSSLPLEMCQQPGSFQGFSSGAMCGRLEVLEDRSNPESRTITLNITVIPAVSRSPEPDPLFLLAGGPGQAATEAFDPILPAFLHINQKRDLVLIDQRGTGSSSPLNCPEVDENADSNQDIERWIEACLESIDGDPQFYTTLTSVEDLEQVRKALGYKQINLYGVSYGTRLALTYLKQHPENIRSVILDGVVPQDEAIGLNAAHQAQRVLEALFTRCMDQADCSRAFPDLPQAFQSLIDTLEENPVNVTVSHPTGGAPVAIQFNKEMMATAFQLLSYSSETAALLPLLVHHTYTTGDWTRLAAQYLLVEEQIGQSISAGLQFSVLCAEDAPFIDHERAARMNAGTYLGDQQSENLLRICILWPSTTAPAWFKEPVGSDHPVLLLSGEDDPITPPEYAGRAAEHLPNSLHLVLRGQGHNVIYRGCVPFLAASFLEAASTTGLNPACVEQIRPMPFFTNFAGPPP